MIRICSGFPPHWPAEYRERFLASIAEHWPAQIEALADILSQGGDLDRHRLILPRAAADDMADGDLLAWLDPEIETNAAIPSYVIPQLMKDADLCFIGDGAGGSDFAFWAVRLSSPARTFLMHLADNGVAGMTAGEAWADARARAPLAERDLTPGGSGDIWEHGPLGRYTIRRPRPE